MLKDFRAKIFYSIDFFKLLLRIDNYLLVSKMKKKNWGSPASFQR